MNNTGDSPFSKQHMKWLDRNFKRVWPLLEKAIDRMSEPYDMAYVWGRIADSTAQLFPGTKSALVSEINEAIDGSRSFNIWLAGGELQEVFHLASVAKKTARDAGCVAVTFISRPGFARKFPEGFKTTAVVMRKEL